jgi:hypothetical protein
MLSITKDHFKEEEEEKRYPTPSLRSLGKLMECIATDKKDDGKRFFKWKNWHQWKTLFFARQLNDITHNGIDHTRLFAASNPYKCLDWNIVPLSASFGIEKLCNGEFAENLFSKFSNKIERRWKKFIRKFLVYVNLGLLLEQMR